MRESGPAGRGITNGSETAASARAAKAHQGRVDMDVRALLIRINDAGYRALRQLALNEDTTLQALAIEALNELLKKHGAKPVVTNPLRQAD